MKKTITKEKEKFKRKERKESKENNKLNVLHVDDDSAYLELFSISFGRTFKIKSLTSIKKAFSELKTGEIDVVVTDFEMPEMDGLEFLKAVKEEHPDIPVIFQTGQGNEDIARQAFIHGASDYFTKDYFSFAFKEKISNSIKKAVKIRKTTKEKKESERKYKNLLESLQDLVFTTDTEGKITFANKAFERTMGKKASSFIGTAFSQYIVTEDRLQFTDSLARKMKSGELYITCEVRLQSFSWGVRCINFNCTPLKNEEGQFIGITGTGRDITDQKRIEKEKLLAAMVMRRINNKVYSHNMIKDFITLIKNATNIEAVGLRLEDGDDFPYFETKGFPDDFVKLENSLCVRDLDGQIMRDEIGKPFLECMCGNVIRGRTDPSFPFFTKGGSFWSNCTTDLLKNTTEKERQARTRNRCNGEGYESVALIPLRTRDGIIGLLQLNDHRKNCFTPEMIEFFEGLSFNIGTALSQSKDRQEIADLSKFALENPNPVIRMSLKGEILFANEAGEELFAVEDAINEKNAIKSILKEIQIAIDSGKRRQVDITGNNRIYSFTIAPLLDRGYVNLYGINVTEQRNAEKALKESEERFRAFFENSDAGMVLFDVKGRPKYKAINDSLAATNGLPAKDHIGKTIGEILLNDKQVEEEHLKLFDKIKQSRGPIVFEAPINRHDGSPGYYLAHYFPLFDHNKNIKSIGGVIIDLTKQKLLENQVKESEKKYRTLVENLNEGIWSIDNNGNTTFVNEKMTEILGYTVDEMIGKNVADFCPKEEIEKFQYYFERRMNGIEEQHDFWFYKKDRSRVFVRMITSPLCDESGNVVGAIAGMMDVTERRKAEEELRLSEKRYRNLLELLPQTVCEFDTKGNVKYMNTQGLKSFGYNEEDLKKGLNLSQLTVPKDLDSIWDKAPKLLSGEEEPGGEYIGIRKDGTRFFGKGYSAPVYKNNEQTGWLSTFVDVSDYKELEKMLRAGRERFYQVLETMPAYVYLQRPDYKIDYANKKFKELFGEPGDKPCYEVIHGFEEPCSDCKTFETFKDQKTHECEWKDTRTGRTFWVIDSFLESVDGEPLVLEFGIDITQRKELEQKYRNITENSLQGIGIIQDNKLVFANNALIESCGFAIEEINSSGDDTIPPIVSNIHPDDANRMKIQMEKRFKGEKLTDRSKLRIIKKNGEIMWIEVLEKLIEYEGKPAIQFAQIDITEQVKANDELAKFKKIADKASFGMGIINDKGILSYINTYSANVHGYIPEELIGKPVSILHSKRKPEKLKNLIDQLNTKGSFASVEMWHRRKDGTEFPMLMNGVKVKSDLTGETMFAATSIDITQLKKAEETLKNSEEKFRQYFELGIMAMVVEKPSGEWISMNDYMCDMLGYSRDELMKKHWFELTHPEDLIKDQSQFEKLLAGEISGYTMDKRFIRKDGEIIYCQIGVSCSRKANGEVERVYGAAVDITDRVKTQKALKKSREEYRSLIENVSDTIYSINKKGIINFMSPSIIDFGYKPEELEGNHFLQYIQESDQEVVLDHFTDILNNGSKPSHLFRIKGKTGGEFWVESQSNVIKDESGNSIGIIGAIRDVSEIIRQKNQIEHLNRILKSIRNIGKLITEEKDPKNLAQKACDLLTETRGYESAFIILTGKNQKPILGVESNFGKDFDIFYKLIESGEYPYCIRKALEEKGLCFCDIFDGTNCNFNKYHPHRESIVNILCCEDELCGLIGVYTPSDMLVNEEELKLFKEVSGDIGYALFNIKMEKNRSRILEALNTSRKAEKHINIAGILIMVLDSEARVKMINPRGCAILGYDEEEITGKNWFDNFIPQRDTSKIKSVFKSYFYGSYPEIDFHYENSIVNSKGEERMISWHNTRLRSEKGEAMGILCMGADVTDRKILEEKLKHTLKEKEILLMEVNHRAKNNLQVISSLLQFQIMRADNEKTVELLLETRNRLNAMAMIHEMLCSQEDVGKIDFRGLLMKLVSNITSSYEYLEKKITYEIDSIEIYLDIRSTITCSLIINELISNSIKHAFPDGRAGIIRIKVKRNENIYILEFSDSGIGLPKHLDLKKSRSLGMKIIHLLVNQLKGKIKIDILQGTRFIIEFPV